MWGERKILNRRKPDLRGRKDANDMIINNTHKIISDMIFIIKNKTISDIIRNQAKAGAVLIFWHELAINGYASMNAIKRQELIDADFQRLRNLIWPEDDR